MPSSQAERQLHKSSPFFILFDNIRKLILPALIALLGTRGSTWEYYALAGAALVSIVSIIQYFFYRYWIDEDKIKVKEGIIFRNLREVEYNKIQNLNLVQNPFHRLFGVAKVQLESASGGKPEAVINVISLAAVEELKQKIHGEEETLIQDTQQREEAVTKEPILKVSFADIARYGIISNKGLVAVALFIGFVSQFVNGKNSAGFVKNTWSKGVEVANDTLQAVVPEGSILSNIIYGILLMMLGIIVLWLLSIIMAWFKFHNFNLTEHKQKLSANLGLITNVTATIPMSRIQTLTIHNSWLHRLFKRITVTIETAGGVNSEQQGITMKFLAPVLEAQRKETFLAKVQPDVDWSQQDWIKIEARAWRRVFKVVAIIWTLVLLPSNLYSSYLYLSLWLLMMVANYFYSKAYVNNTAYFLAEDVLAFKSGVVFKKESYVRLPKVQTAKIKESMFDRRHKMASVEVDTAGASIGAHHVNIPYLNLADAQLVHQFIVSRVKNIRFEW